MLESIPVATDGSRFAEDAVEVAGFLAAKCGSRRGASWTARSEKGRG